MAVGVAWRAVWLVGAFLGLAAPAWAADCPSLDGAGGPERPLALRQLLELPNQPDPSLENTQVATVGYLARVHRVSAKTLPCPGSPYYRLWLSAHDPVGLKGIATRHRAVVALVPGSALQGLGGERGLDRLRGKRIWISGRMTFNAGARDDLMKTRGSLWEFRVVSGLGACPSKTCSASQHPAPDVAPPARTERPRR